MIILTGAAGFIGSCFLEKLNEQGIRDVIVVDRLGHGNKWKNLVGKRFHEFIHKEHFRDMLTLNILDYEIEAIVHFGACSATTESDADYLMDNNYTYSVHLAEFARENDIRFIYASSAATYGLGENGYSDNRFNALKPLNMYGLSKHLFDQWVIDNKLDKTFTGLKFFNVFGPNEYHKGDMSSMVYKAFNQIKSTGKVKLFKSNHPDYKDGEQMRDFVYVKDCVEVLWKIFDTPDFSGIYNLGTGLARNWNDLANAVFQAMDKPVNIEYVEMPESLQGQYQNFTQAEMQKLKDKCPDVKFGTLEDSIEDYVKNYLLKL